MSSPDSNVIPVLSLGSRLQALESEVLRLKARLEAQPDENIVSIICFSGEWDKLFAALTIASGSLAMDKEVHLFFTFWGLNALRCSKHSNNGSKSLPQTLLGRILPCGPGKARLSRLNFGGLGKRMMKHVMKKSGVDDIDVLFQDVKELGAHFHVCDTTAELFGLQCTELSDIENMDRCGVATFLSFAQKSKMVLFI
jgi:peroxiredoxin family protein